MKKRWPVLLILLFILIAPISAEWDVTFWDWKGHPRIVAGLIPTSIQGELAQQFFFGGETVILGSLGYHERLLWQDPITGSLRSSDPLIYDVMFIDLGLGYRQKLFRGASIGANWHLRYERAFDSIAVGSTLESGEVLPLNSWAGTNVHYGSLKGVSQRLSMKVVVDYLDDTMTATDGWRVDLAFIYGPKRRGITPYWGLFGTGTVGLTIGQEMDGDRNLFSVTLVDRLLASGVGSEMVDLVVQEMAAFGAKIRGFDMMAFPVRWSVANQLDFRINGPEPFLPGFFPRLTFFIDAGLGWGTLFNTDVKLQGSLLASSGVITNFFLSEYLDFGFQMAYLLAGENYSHPGSKMVGQITARLSF
jgi:hypothetical protein